MTRSSVAVRPRDAERTREAVLDAAETLFAERGYKATSLVEVGRRAGVSRGTPGYFFGSKEQLYRAVLERAFQRARAVLAEARERAAASGNRPQALLHEAVTSYLDFLKNHPTFVRLVEWEALGGGRFLGDVPAHLIGLREALSAAEGEMATGAFRKTEAAHLLISIMGLCWFPFAHAQTVMRSLGLDAQDPAFVESRKRHVIDLLLNGLAPVSERGMPSRRGALAKESAEGSLE